MMHTPARRIFARSNPVSFTKSQDILIERTVIWLRTFWGKLAFVAVFLVAFLCVGAPVGAQSKAKAPVPSPAAANAGPSAPGNEACGKCHSKILESYAQIPMAQGSGPATQGFLPGDFRDAGSGVHYRVNMENGEVWLSFDRDGDAPLHGKRKFEYFIGSGHRGKTFVFSNESFAFESPINFYSHVRGAPGGIWDMAPKYQGAKEMPLNLPAASSCLSCHTSDAQVPEAGTENKYGSPLFAHGGITCERCHGSDVSHGSKAQKPSKSIAGTLRAGVNDAPGIINPATLTPGRRDAVCMQCHLEGNAAIQQPGKHLYEYRPGDDLSEFVRYYVYTGDGKDNVRAVSQFEALAQSKCKRATGDSMTCTSCHDPHFSPAAAERATYFRGKCLACHGEAFGAKHHVEQQDCASCHMQRLPTLDVAHTQASDHRILRVPQQDSGVETGRGGASEPKLVRFPPVKEEDSLRGLALAWVTLAGTESAFAETRQLLPKALAQSPNDPELLSALGYDEQRRGLTEQAREHYEHALRVAPLSLDAAANLALIEANAGNLERATALWKSAFERAPGKSTLGINLVRALCLSGHGEEAKATIARVLEFNPDLSTARGMLKQLETGEVKCVAE
jgi:tetratricopeptide (TPR) repeat protein